MSNKPKQLEFDFHDKGDCTPPSTNRGVTVSIHWLSITFFSDIKTPMTHFLRKFLWYQIEDEMEWSEHFFNTKRGARGYQTLYMGPENVRLYGFPHTGKHCHLEIPGQVLELYGTQQAIKYLKSLSDLDIDWRCTRIDIAFDYVPFTPKQVYEAWKRNDVQTKCHHKSYKWWENADGETMYIGSMQSERFIRIYNKRGFTRLELVFKDRWSENFAIVITEIPSEHWIGQCIGYLRDYVNFIDKKSKDKKDEIYKNLSWWNEFVTNTERVKLDIEKKDSTVNLKLKYKSYFERLIPTLYIVKYGLNIDLNHVVENSFEKLKSHHVNKLKKLKS